MNSLYEYYSSKKRDRKKKHQASNSTSENQNDLVAQSGDVPGTCISIKEIQMAMEVFKLQHKPAKTQEEAMQKAYQFWSTQPVPKMGKFYFF